MPLLNYTTSVPASRTAHQIVEMLAAHGAKQVLLDYGTMRYNESQVTGLSFAIETDIGMMRYRLPVDVAAVEKVMREDRQIPKRFKVPIQAERVAWRILKDWIEAQLALIATRMVTLDQIMLPYMLMTEGSTVYDLYRTKQLEIGSGS